MYILVDLWAAMKCSFKIKVHLHIYYQHTTTAFEWNLMQCLFSDQQISGTKALWENMEKGINLYTCWKFTIFKQLILQILSIGSNIDIEIH